MSLTMSRRIAALEAELLRGPRDEAQAVEDAESIAAFLEAMDRTAGDVEPESVD